MPVLDDELLISFHAKGPRLALHYVTLDKGIRNRSTFLFDISFSDLGSIQPKDAEARIGRALVFAFPKPCRAVYRKRRQKAKRR
jgi:hypothetical protein